MAADFERMRSDFPLKRSESLSYQQQAVFAIGNFDGVHLGHQEVLKEALSLARRLNQPAFVLTFEPHPKSFFTQNGTLVRLTSADQKAEIFKLLGFDGVIEQKFDENFANITAQDFVEVYLIKMLNASAVVTGEDFCFGRAREGDKDFLKQKALEHNFHVKFVPLLKNVEGVTISSTSIRDFLQNKDVAQAASFLGRRYAYQSTVEYGSQLGRKLGYPTANLSFKGACPLGYGIYAVHLRRQNGQIHKGVASVGVRPTIGADQHPLLETYLFDFNDNLYHEKVEVSFFHYLRNEEKFHNLDSLVAKISQDVQQAEALLLSVSALGMLDEKLHFPLA